MADEKNLSTSPCCWLYLCCPPGAASEALAAELKIPVETATMLLERFRLVPVAMAPTAEARGSAMALAAGDKLVELNRHVRRELREILFELGYHTPRPPVAADQVAPE